MFHIFASGSSGNYYEVDDNNTRLAIECGLAFSKIQRLCGHSTADLAGCLISHEHMDHAKGAKEMSKRGVPLYMSEGTADKLKLTGSNIHIMKPLKTIRVGSFSVKPFPVEHDAAEPFGFLFFSNENKRKLMFATDTQCLRYRFKGVHEIAVECNYSEDLLRQSDLPEVVIKRISRSHMSIETVKRFLSESDLTKTEFIYLLHLSGNHSHAQQFVQEIQENTGIITRVWEGLS